MIFFLNCDWIGHLKINVESTSTRSWCIQENSILSKYSTKILMLQKRNKKKVRIIGIASEIRVPRRSGETDINGSGKKNQSVLEVKSLLLSRFLAEYERVRNALLSLKSVSSRSWPTERNRVYFLQRRLTADEQDAFPVIAEMDIEAYVLCIAAATQKYCVNEDILNIMKTIRLFFLITPVVLVIAYIAFFNSHAHKVR